MLRFNHDFSSRFRILKGGKVSLVVSAMLLGGALQAVATSFNAVVTTSSKTFVVPDDTNDSNNGINNGELLGGKSTCEIMAGEHRYYAQSFIAGQTAPTDINTTGLTGFVSEYGPQDNFMAVYDGVFDPNNITKGLLGCNDDSDHSDDSKDLWSEFTANLDANKSYTMVFTAFSAVNPTDATSTTGEGTFSISPNVSLVTTTTATEDSAFTYNLPSLAPADYNGTITKPSWITYSSGLSNSSLFADLGTNGGGYSTSGPVGMAVDPDGNIYIALSYGQIFKVTSSGVVSSLTTTGLTGGYGEIVYDNGYLYLTDGNNQKITKLNLSTNEITTVSDTLSYIPRTITKSGNNIYFHIYNRSDIQWIPSIGTNGTPTSLTLTGATFDPMYVVDMVTDSLGDIYALTAKQKVGTVYKIDLDSAGTSGVVSQVTTTDFPMNETYPRQSGLAIDSKDNLYVLHQSMIEMINRDGTPLGSTYTGGYSGDIAVDTNGNIYTSINNGGNSKIFKATNGPKLTGTPTNNDLGENRVTLSVDDGSTRDYIITVANTNDVPTLTTMSTLTDANQSIPKEITFANLQAAGDEADIDIDDNVTSFIVKSVTTGTLKIGADYASAIAFDATTNKEINATNKAYWTATTAGSGINAFTVVAKDNHNGESTTPIQVKFDVAPDVTAPTLSALPQIAGTTTVSQVSFTATVSEASTGYWVVLPSSATAPSATQIVAGQDSTGTSTTIKGNSAMVADTNTTFTISGIDGDMEYKIYFVPKDSAGNLGELQTLSFATPAYVHFTTSSTIADSSCWNGNIWIGNTTCSSTTIADIQSKLQTGDVTISVSGDINITQPISWNANKLILTSNKDIHISADMNISGTGGVEFKTGFDGTNYLGTKGLLYVDMDENHGFKGAVNLTDNSTLNINGNAYTIIRTLTDLTNWRATFTSDGYHALGSNITMSGNAPAAMRTVGQALNGLGHTISGYHSTAGSNGVGKYVGFLRGIQGGEISNLMFVDVNISGDYGLGILTPNIDSVAGKTIKLYNLYTAGTVTETDVSNSDTQAGGIASMINAYNGPFYIENVHSSANITAKDRLGGLFGLVGCSSSGAINTIKNISSSGTILSIGNTAGGLIGNLYSGNGVTMNFSDLSFSGSVTGGATSTSIGGIIGNLSGGFTGLNTIKNVETNATIYGLSKVGGIIGETSTSINNISNTTFSGTITTPASASNIGGIVGYAGNTGTTISSNIFDGNISAGTGSTVVGGIVGYKNANVIDNSVKKMIFIGDVDTTAVIGSTPTYFGVFIGRDFAGSNTGNTPPNFAPTSSDLNITMYEDTTKTFVSSDFSFSDIDANSSLHSVVITSLPDKGTLKLNDVNVTIGQTILVGNISQFTFTPVPDDFGTSYTSFKFRVNDGESNSTAEYTATINVNDVAEGVNITVINGESITTQLVPIGATFDTIPTKEGYTFAGWYTDTNLSQKFDPRNVMTATTLYPKWVANTANSVTMSVNTLSYGVREVTLSTAQGLTVSNATNDATQTTAGKIKLPFGSFAFNISGGATGFTAPMSIIVDKNVGSFTYYKQNNAGKWVNLTKKITFLANDKVKIDFDLTDGGVFDRDGSANGTIVDPGGVATNALNPYVIEGTTLVGDASFVEDPNLFVGTLSYTITGGANSALFEIESSSGELSFKNAPVYSTTTSNNYFVEVTASGSTSGKEIRAIMVTVLNADGDNVIAPVGVAESCGTSARKNLLVAPTAGFCQSGIASAVSETNNIFTWNCNNGDQGATPIPCSAKKVVPLEIVVDNIPQGAIVTDNGDTKTVTSGTNTVEATKFTAGDAKTEHIAKANGAELSKATSFVEGTQITVKPTGDVETKVEMLGTNNTPVSIVVDGKVSGEDKAVHTLNVGGKVTKAKSKMTGTVTQIKVDGEVETKATVSGNEAKATALPDGTATHIIKVGLVESKATVEIAGAQTVIDTTGITTSVDENQTIGGNAITVKSIVKTDTQGESQTWFEDSTGKQLERTVSQRTPLESGAEVKVNKDTNGKLQFKIKTKVTRDLTIE